MCGAASCRPYLARTCHSSVPALPPPCEELPHQVNIFLLLAYFEFPLTHVFIQEYKFFDTFSIYVFHWMAPLCLLSWTYIGLPISCDIRYNIDWKKYLTVQAMALKSIWIKLSGKKVIQEFLYCGQFMPSLHPSKSWDKGLFLGAVLF